MRFTIKKETMGLVDSHSEEMNSVFKMIQSDKKELLISKMRYSLQYLNNEARKEAIKKLPQVVFGAEYQTQGNAEVMKAYNGTVLLQINSLVSIDEAVAVRKLVSDFPQTLAAFIGSSGKSVKFLVRFIRPDGSLPRLIEEIKLFHKHAYQWAVKVYQGQLNYKISLKDPLIDRACRLSCDPDLYFAPDALLIKLEQPTQQVKEVAIDQNESVEKRLLKVMPNCNVGDVYTVLFESALISAIHEIGNNWQEEMNSLFVKVANSCYQSGVPQERVIKGLVDHFDRKMQELEVRMMVNNTYEVGKGFGKKPCIGSEQLMALRTEEFMERRYEFRYNTQLCEVEYRERESFNFNFAPVTNRVLNSVAINALTEGLQLWDRDVKRYIYSDRVKSYAPVENFLSVLPQWDGKDRISDLADCVPTDHQLWKDAFHRWFLCMVAHWQGVDKEHANSTSPLLIGPQGFRKSTFCRAIIPPQLRTYYTDSIDFSHKRDAELFLNRFALINIDEFDQISASQQGFLKHILQKPVVNLRKPNQACVQELRRYASFIGTSNHHDLLSDTSGSRRFICINVTAPIEMLHVIDYNQLYAQAIHEINAGKRYWFSYEEEMMMTKSNNQFEQTTPAEQLFNQYFRVPYPTEKGEYLLASEIYGRLQKRSSFKLSPTKMISFGRILNKLVVPSKRSNNGYLYNVVEL